jgi:hypothetical protein
VSEAEEQRQIIRWFRETYPEYAMCLRVSLAGLNFGSGQRAARMVNHIRSQGIHPGEADILIAIQRGGYGSLVIEHKAEGSAYRATPEQLQYIDRHNQVHNCAVVTRGVDAAKAAIIAYMAK